MVLQRTILAGLVLLGAVLRLDAYLVPRGGSVHAVGRLQRSSLHMNNKRDDRLDKGNVDWDSEWKKIATSPPKDEAEQPEVAEQPKVASGSRPRGLDDMSELERSTLRATRRVAGLGQQAVRKAEGLSKSSKKMKLPGPKGKVKVPSFKRLSKDWRFWVGLIAVASFGTSVLTALSQNGGDDLII